MDLRCDVEHTRGDQCVGVTLSFLFNQLPPKKGSDKPKPISLTLIRTLIFQHSLAESQPEAHDPLTSVLSDPFFTHKKPAHLDPQA